METIRKAILNKAASNHEVEAALQQDRFREIDTVNWSDYSDIVSCRWKMLHSQDAWFLYFETKEPYVRARYTGDSSPVCEDSCVEFFVSFNDLEYYNFEFNPIGACTIQKGPNRHTRNTFRLSELPGLRVWTSEAETPFETREYSQPWKVWCVIPLSLFGGDRSMHKDRVKANFYKCGDGLPTQHYLSWAPVYSEAPDFHRPEYFKELLLEN